ncbi:MAG: GNAT family N-acetyltransferase [Anaerolineales bacterium]
MTTMWMAGAEPRSRQIKPRSYRTEDDFWNMRQLLRRAMLANAGFERSWHVARLDYARWHSLFNCAKLTLQDVVTLWEADGELVAFILPDGERGEAHFCFMSEVLTEGLASEMLGAAEKSLASVTPDGAHQLEVWVDQHNAILTEAVRAAGYQLQPWAERQWHLDLAQDVPQPPMPAGYDIHPLGDGLELLERCYASGLGFHNGDIATAVDNRSDPGWYRNIQKAPLYRRDLDLVAEAADGSIAAFCTLWFDDVTRTAYIEPVATVPAHQRRGLARALLTEGLRRLREMGATRAFVSGYTDRANALYGSIMSPEPDLCQAWARTWRARPQS